MKSEQEIKQKIKELETELHDESMNLDTDEIDYDYGFIGALKWIVQEDEVK